MTSQLYFTVAVSITIVTWLVALVLGAIFRSDNDGPWDHWRTQREARGTLALLGLGLFSVLWIAYLPVLVLFYLFKFVRYALGGLLHDAGITPRWRTR